MKHLNRILLVVLLSIGVGFVVPVDAQELTDAPIGDVLAEATEIAAAPEMTAAAPDMSVVVEDGGTVNIDAPDTSSLLWLIDLIKIIVAAIVAGGSFALMWDRIRRSKQAKDTIERLAEGLSPAWQSTFDRALEYSEAANKRLAETIQFLREVSDGKPNTEGIPVPPGAQLTPQQMLAALIGTPEFEVFLARHTEQVESRVLAQQVNNTTAARDAPPVVVLSEIG